MYNPHRRVFFFLLVRCTLLIAGGTTNDANSTRASRGDNGCRKSTAEGPSPRIKAADRKENRPGLLKEIRTARGTVDVLASEYLKTIQRCRYTHTDDTASNERSRNVGKSAFLASFHRPSQRRRSLSTDRLEQICLH